MPALTSDDLGRRRQLEDDLVRCGQEREWLLEYKERINSGKVRALLAGAREAGITVRDISRMTGISTQTLHTWMKRHMQPIPAIHYGLQGHQAATLEEAVLRTIGEDCMGDWRPEDVVPRIPAGWPTGSVEEVAEALERLARAHLISDGEQEGTYRVQPSQEIAAI